MIFEARKMMNKLDDSIEILKSYDNPLQNVVSEMAKFPCNNIEKAIKETIEQGFNYMVVKRETVYEGNKATMKIQYKGFYDISAKLFIEQGYEVFDLGKVREYLKEGLSGN